MRRVILGLSILCALFGGYLLLQQRTYTEQASASNAPDAIGAPFKTAAGLPDANAIFRLVNQQRVLHGQLPLERNDKLTAVAESRAVDMQMRTYYAHKNPDGRYFYDIMKDQNTDVAYACENLDLQFSTDPTQYISDWMNSTKGHKECLLNAKTTEAGYAVAPVAVKTYSYRSDPTFVVVAIHAQMP